MDGRQEIPLGPPPKKPNLTDVQTIRVHATKNRLIEDNCIDIRLIFSKLFFLILFFIQWFRL